MPRYTKKTATIATLLAVSQIAALTVLNAQQPRPRNSPPPPPPPPQKGPAAPSPADLPVVFFQEFRSIDGSRNNRTFPEQGEVGTFFTRLLPSAYGDGISTPAGAVRPSARAISNGVCTETGSIPNARGVSDFFYQWGQFIDHDITLIGGVDPAEAFNIAVPTGDPYFDPNSTGTMIIPFSRSYNELVNGKAEQVNDISTYIDASMVYGSDSETAMSLRTLDGTGHLRVSDGNLLPFVTTTDEQGNAADTPFFLAGDIRLNEQIRLIAMHTLFMREHNYWADKFHQQNPNLSDETLYQLARNVVAAEIQSITYREFLPLLLGTNGIPAYRGYKPQVNPTITNEFTTVAYRFGHSMLSPILWRLDANGNPVTQGNIALRDAFFTPWEVNATDIDPILRGMAAQQAEELDAEIIDDVRNFLFGQPGSGGFDLASLNIQRGRDHGMPSYNAARRALGLRPAVRFSDIDPNPAGAQKLADTYGSVELVDFWIGGLSERKIPGTMVGETFMRILGDQFTRLRDGDRFWYQNYLPDNWKRYIDTVRLSDVIRRNTTIARELQDNAFLVPRPAAR